MRRAPVRSFHRRGFTSPDERARMKRSVDVSGKGRAPDRLAVNRVILSEKRGEKRGRLSAVLGRASVPIFSQY